MYKKSTGILYENAIKEDGYKEEIERDAPELHFFQYQYLE